MEFDLGGWELHLGDRSFSLADEEEVASLLEEALDGLEEGELPRLSDIPVRLSEEALEAFWQKVEARVQAYHKRLEALEEEAKATLRSRGENPEERVGGYALWELELGGLGWDRPTPEEEAALDLWERPPENLYVLVPQEDLVTLLPRLPGEPAKTVSTMLGERCLACGGLVSPSAAWANLPGAPPLGPRPALGHRTGCPWEGDE